MSGSYDVTIGGVDRGIIPGNVTFTDVTLRTRVTKPDEVPIVLVIKSVEVKMGLLAILGLNLSTNLDLKIGNEKQGYGHIKGNITLPKLGKAGVTLALEGTDLQAASLPMQGALGLPMRGKVDFAINLDLPVTKNKMGRTSTDWTKAEGTLDLSCAACTLGDGKAKLKPLLKNRSNQVMVGDGIDIGEIAITSMEAHAVFTPAVGDPEAHSSSYKPGKFELAKFELKSPDGELHVDYLMTMATTIDESIVAGCLRFKPNDSLLKRERRQEDVRCDVDDRRRAPRRWPVSHQAQRSVQGHEAAQRRLRSERTEGGQRRGLLGTPDQPGWPADDHADARHQDRQRHDADPDAAAAAAATRDESCAARRLRDAESRRVAARRHGGIHSTGIVESRGCRRGRRVERARAASRPASYALNFRVLRPCRGLSTAVRQRVRVRSRSSERRSRVPFARHDHSPRRCARPDHDRLQQR